jgi:hypothetical protein
MTQILLLERYLNLYLKHYLIKMSMFINILTLFTCLNKSWN